MGLKLYYKKNDEFVAITNSGDLTSPLTTVHDGKTGDTQTVQCYIRNDNSSKYYSNIVITPVDLVDANPYGDVIYSETGWGVKLNAGASEPTEGQWNDLDWGDSISMSNIGASGLPDTTTYYPFWYLVTCPPNTNAKVKTDIVLQVSYTENAVV